MTTTPVMMMEYIQNLVKADHSDLQIWGEKTHYVKPTPLISAFGTKSLQ